MAAVFPYWDLTWELVQRELRVRYRRSLIGFAWTMLQPMLMMGVLHIAFSTIFRFNVDNYPVYVLAGLLFWNFFSHSIVTSMNSLRANGGLIQKLPVPKSVFPLAVVISDQLRCAAAALGSSSPATTALSMLFLPDRHAASSLGAGSHPARGVLPRHRRAIGVIRRSSCS
jgi:ABC-type polysaccharide/polyol phosphate export permease